MYSHQSTFNISPLEHICCLTEVQSAVLKSTEIKLISLRKGVYFGSWIIQGQNSVDVCCENGLDDRSWRKGISFWNVTYSREVEARLLAVEEIKDSNNYKLEDIGGLLTRLPDLEKGLVRIHYGRVLSPYITLT